MVNWISNDTSQEDVIISSRIRLARNIKNHRFPHAFQEGEADAIDSLFRETAEDLFEKDHYHHVFMRDLDLVGRRVLMENHLISPELIKNKNFSSFILSEDEKINLMINEEDHLRLQVLLPGMELQKAYEIAAELDTKLEEKIEFAFDEHFGYLTACPTNTGTGMRASVMAHLPGLNKSGLIPGLSDSLNKIGLAVRGLHGEGSEALGDLFQISNQKTLGMTEAQVIEKLEPIVYRIVTNERQIRNTSKRFSEIEVEDAVFRALGTLKFARKITDKEALQCLSTLRAGIHLGIYQGLTSSQVLTLMFSTQKYNIIQYKKKHQLNKSEDAVRADYLIDFFNKEEIHG